MGPAVTTRCCSALAVIALLADATPPTLPFFPTRPIWSLALNNPLAPESAPVFDGGRGFIPIAGDRLAAYDLKSGTMIWTVGAAPAMPLAAGGDLVFYPESGAIVALHADDGSAAWRLPFDRPLAVPPVWDNGWLVIATTDARIVAISGADGRIIWQRELNVAARARPALAADRVYVPLANATVAALNVTTGEPVWQRRLGGDPTDILALDERIYVGSTDHYLYCLEADTGDVGWRSMRTGAAVIGVPAYDDDRIYFVAFDNVLRAVSRRSGVQHWMKQLPLRPTSGPIRVGSTIIVSGNAAALPTYNAKDGSVLGTLAVAPEPAAPPTLVVDAASGQPQVMLVTGDIAKGATVSLVARTADPTPGTSIVPLTSAITTLPPLSLPGASAARGQD
ncbi:MAG TPA: PQQ-binding-like beta-propeller repeat protein [Vicinamibacterales bacterium]|nr:PQQ-binding-like beta-propeller repeat protein [Vicinamibacterales bacterium]